MASCEDMRPMLGAYSDGQLSPIEADAVALHLERCGRCRQIVRDQEHVQHVFDSYQPPPVADEKWDEIGRRLRAELEGGGQRLTLKTRPRTDMLDPTPQAVEALRPEETRARRATGTSGAKARLRPTAATPVTIGGVLRVSGRRPRPHLRWLAHAAGALAAVAVLAIAAAALLLQPPPGAGPAATAQKPSEAAPIALARPQDVTILSVVMSDPDYSLVLDTGNASDAATVLVVPGGGDS
jgi:hypothetical protein